MMDDNRRNYLQYANQVLGIEKVIRPESEIEVSQLVEEVFHTRTGHWPDLKQFDVVVVHLLPEESLFSADVFELYQKMKYAMKLNEVTVLELQVSQSPTEHQWKELFKKVQCRSLLVFSVSSDHEVFVGKDLFTVTTISPALLLKNESLKRQAWDDGKRLMKFLELK